MIKLTISTGTEKDFFKRGREIARKLDKGQKIESRQVITFEDPEDLLALVTSARVALFKSVKKAPASITEIAARLHRDRSAVKRDIDILAAAGLVEVEEKTHPGHGRIKFVKAVADEFQLTALVA